MFKSLHKLVVAPKTREAERRTAGESDHSHYIALVHRIMAGDSSAETELWDRFRPGVFHIVLGIVKDYQMAEDLTQDTFFIIIGKMRRGDVRQPESLAGFVAQVARLHAFEQIRKHRRQRLEDLEEAEQLPDPTPDRLKQLEKAEEFDEVRALIGQLNPRDRELIMRLYINEQPKNRICDDLGLTSSQFDRALYRARKRYKALYLKRKERAQRGNRR
jgi:RNA polymerase sigma-70 factor (ECF subfamily)